LDNGHLMLHRCLAALAVVSLLALSSPAPARPVVHPAVRAETAETVAANFVRRLNDTGPNGWTSGTHDSEFDPAFNALLETNGSLASHRLDGPDYDGDPVCQCQDGGKHYTLLATVHHGPAAFEAQVQSDNTFGDGTHETQRYAIVFHLVRGHWLVWDVVAPSDGSTRVMLTRHNACLRAGHGYEAINRCFNRH
jgi:hypothetical protein